MSPDHGCARQRRVGFGSAGKEMTTAAAGALALLGGWSIAVPYVDGALGLRVDVVQKVEVVDHVVPGAIVVAALAAMALRRPARGSVWVLAPCVAFLAGFWMTSTHVPLVLQAADGEAPWGGALFHTSPGPAVAVLSLWLLTVGIRASENADADG